MAQFFYKAKSGPKETITGIIEADTVAQAVAKLTGAGRVPIDVKPYVKALLPTEAKTVHDLKVSRTALFQFTRQLADLQEAGVPLARSMELLSRQGQFPAMLVVIESMTSLLQQGGSLSLAMARYPRIFPAMYVQTIKAAEASGQLPLVLNRLAQFLESDIQIRSNVKASLLYPAIIFLVGLLTLFVLLSFVLPRLAEMFEDFDAQLPLMTRIVVGISGFFAHFWWLMAIGAVGMFWWARAYLSNSKTRADFDAFCLKLPLLKTFIENTQVSRFARTLGMLLESGVPIVTALESVTTVVDNSALQEEIRKMTLKVKSGMGLAQAVKASLFFPEMAVDLIAVGQESGRLEKGLYKLASNCERSAQEMSQVFMTVLGPAVLVVVVGLVGFMVVAMLMPMFQMNMIIN